MTIPFSTYDFFGNLASGVVLLIAFDLISSDVDLIHTQMSIQVSVLVLLAAYILGQTAASMSGWLLESQITNRVLGRPTIRLFAASDSRKRLGRLLFPGYFTPLPDEIAQRVLRKSSSFGIGSPGEALFHHARTVAKTHAVTWQKMEDFLARYGFSRNIAFALWASALLVALFGSSLTPDDQSRLSLLPAVFGLTMYYRCLKFYRQYAYEMYTSYPDIEQPK